MNLGGSLTRQAEADHNVSDASPHIANIGRMVEVSSGMIYYSLSLSLSQCLLLLVFMLLLWFNRIWKTKSDQLLMRYILARPKILSMI